MAIWARKAEISRFSPSACLPTLLEVALKLSASTFRETIPTRSVARAPIQSLPRVSRWTRPESASPETAKAVRPTASGTSRPGIAGRGRVARAAVRGRVARAAVDATSRSRGSAAPGESAGALFAPARRRPGVLSLVRRLPSGPVPFVAAAGGRGELPGGAQARRVRARVALDLLGGGGQRPPGERL